jgi:glucose-1-phosphate thymidylyltransferase
MNVVVACGGEGTRMLPITSYLNKHLIPIGNRELMIDAPIRLLIQNSFVLCDLNIVTGSEFAHQVIEHVDRTVGQTFKHIHYSIQPKSAGIADVIKRVPAINGNSCLLILGDNYFENLDIHIGHHHNNAICWLYDVGSIEKAKSFGQIFFDDTGAPKEIVEKPQNSTSSEIITGLYYFPEDVMNKITKLTPSARNELEITSLLDIYLKEGRLDVRRVGGKWFDLGEWNSLDEYLKWRL